MSRVSLAGTVIGLAAIWSNTVVAAPCQDPAAVAAARSAVAEQCPCDSASHGSHVACVAGVVRTLTAAGELPRECGGAVRRCAARSTCGRPGRVTCCYMTGSGPPKCMVTSPERCEARGGCVGSHASCCDACGLDGCIPSEAVCGNGVIEAGEQCDEDGESVCESQSCLLQRYACCQFGSGEAACTAAVAGYTLLTNQYRACGTYGGTFMTGTIPAGSSPCPTPPADYPGATVAGPCVDLPPLPTALSLCCPHPDQTCSDIATADHTTLVYEEWACACENYPARPSVLGNCGPGGACVPAH